MTKQVGSILKWTRLALLLSVSLILADVLGAQALGQFPRLFSQLETKYWAYSPWVERTFYPYVDRDVPWLGGHYRLKTNSLGLKDGATREIARRSDRPRILVVGDSFAEGQGLSWQESAVGRIGTALSAAGMDVLNAGTFYTTVQHYRNKVYDLIDRQGIEVDHVVVFLDISDIPESLRFDIDSDGRLAFPGRREAQIKHFMKTNSLALRTVAVVRDLLQRPAENTQPSRAVDVHDSDWTVKPEKLAALGEPGIETCQRWLDDMRAFLAQRRIPLTLVIYPWATQLWHNDSDSVHRRVWTDWAARHEIRLIDLFPDFFGEEPAGERIDRWYFAHDVHFNAAGAERMASGFLARFAPAAPATPSSASPPLR